MNQHSEQLGLSSPFNRASEGAADTASIEWRRSSVRSFIQRTGLALLLAAGNTACSGDEFTVATGDDDSGDAAETATSETGADTLNDAPLDSGTDVLDAEVDAADAAEAGPTCGKSGNVVFDPTMPCYVEGLYRSGNFLPSPDSSVGGVCEKTACANTPIGGDIEVLWVAETGNKGLFTSVSNPSAFSAHCSPHTLASPPTLSQLKSEINAPTGWFTPTVNKVGTSYTLTSAPSCVGQSALYIALY